MSLLRSVSKALRFLAGVFGAGNRAETLSAGTLGRLQEVIGYRFRSEQLLTKALTHKSSIPAADSNGLQSNERLEFLADAVLNCLVTEHLYHLYPERDEGELSKIKSLVVSRKILGEIGQVLGLGEYMIFGTSEEKTGGRTRHSIISNTFEAVLGALFLDGGYAPAKAFLEKQLFCRINEFCEDERHGNYKSMILEMAQRDGFGIPRYNTLSAIGPDHAKEFRVSINVAGVALGEGTGHNKKIAQQAAAQNALAHYDKQEILSRSKGAQNNELVSH